MRKDSDIEIFKKMIKHQSPIGVKAIDWEQLHVDERKYENGDVDVKLPMVKVVFCFTNRGRLKGIVNYKQ